MVRTTTGDDDKSNKGGTDTCGVDECLNNYTPNVTDGGELRCVTHDPDRHDGDDDLMTPTDAEVAEAFGVDDVDDITDEMLADVDTSVPEAFTDVVDLSTYKTASGAAKAAGRKLKAIADEFGHKPDVEVTVRREELRDGYKWVVYYPAGEYDWAVKMTGGTPVYGADEPVLTGFVGNDDVLVECGSGTRLEFFPR